MKLKDKSKKFGEIRRTIIPPDGGWKEHTIYIVDVSWASNNPIHKAILHTGFITNGSFGGYCEVWQNSYDNSYYASNAYYLKVLKELGKLE